MVPAESPLDLVECVGPSAGGLDNQNVSVPLTGNLLQEVRGNTCAILPRIPAFLNPGNRYNVQLWGFRRRNGSPVATYALVSIRDGRDYCRIDMVQPGDDAVSLTTADYFDFECAAPPPCPSVGVAVFLSPRCWACPHGVMCLA